MTQELIDLRNSILDGRYTDALMLLDELDGMSKKANLRAIKSYVIRLLIHLIKNRVELRLTNSWASSIRSSVVEIQDLNLKESKTSYYIKQSEWQTMLEEALEVAINDASTEAFEGEYSPFQFTEMVDREQILATAEKLLELTYIYSVKELPSQVNEYLTTLPGGEDWRLGKRK